MNWKNYVEEEYSDQIKRDPVNVIPFYHFLCRGWRALQALGDATSMAPVA